MNSTFSFLLGILYSDQSNLPSQRCNFFKILTEITLLIRRTWTHCFGRDNDWGEKNVISTTCLLMWPALILNAFSKKWCKFAKCWVPFVKRYLIFNSTPRPPAQPSNNMLKLLPIHFTPLPPCSVVLCQYDLSWQTQVKSWTFSSTYASNQKRLCGTRSDSIVLGITIKLLSL